jgi:hypothetical protein
VSNGGLRLPTQRFAAQVAARATPRTRIMRADRQRIFVGRILAQHAGRRGAMAPLDRVVRRVLPLCVVAQHAARNEYRPTIRVDIRPQRLVRIREAARPFLVWRTVSQAAAARLSVAPPKPGFFERIFARERRVESIATIRDVVERVVVERSRPASGSSNAAPPQRQAPAVPMIVRRPPSPAPALADVPRQPPTARPALDEWSASPARIRSQGSTPIPLSPSELCSLTDRVVDAIDRRFIAHRERHGRI